MSDFAELPLASDRRQFFQRLGTLSCILGGGLVPNLATVEQILGQEQEPTTESASSTPLSTNYLKKGVNALARAHHMSAMAGHLGAALVAGYFIPVQRPDLSPSVYRGIQGDLEKVIQGESVFGKRMSSKSEWEDRELFEDFPIQKSDPALIDGIAEDLKMSIGKPRQSGHNVIFASLAIRALQQSPELATPSIVEGIRKLMRLFVNQTPGSGYYGKERGRINGNQIALPDNDQAPAYEDLPAMAIAVMEQVLALDPSIQRVGYGGMVHIINHAAAIADLADCGYKELALQAIPAHRNHLRLWLALPNVAAEQGNMPESPFSPHTAEYWNQPAIPYDRALLTHRVKTMFGFDELSKVLDEPTLPNKAYDKLRLLM